MTEWILSEAAADDLIDIYGYTYRRIGARQAERYKADIEDTLDLLVEQPGIGRPLLGLLPDVRRFEHRSHVLFYRVDVDDIFVGRVLHASQDPSLHL